jgi:hypothetical protein
LIIDRQSIVLMTTLGWPRAASLRVAAHTTRFSNLIGRVLFRIPLVIRSPHFVGVFVSLFLVIGSPARLEIALPFPIRGGIAIVFVLSHFSAPLLVSYRSPATRPR